MDSSLFQEYVLEQLTGLEGIRSRPMFGGWGLYAGERFFGIVHGGRLYFKVNHITQKQYEAEGMRPFHPNSKQALKSYYEVPSRVLDDASELLLWAQLSTD